MTAITPLDSSVEAEYADGFILSETEQDDISLWDSGQNTLRDILEKRPEAEHGQLVRFSCFWKGNRYDVNWITLPYSARPIRFREGNRSFNTSTGEGSFWWSKVNFGYQYNDATGKNYKVMKELG